MPYGAVPSPEEVGVRRREGPAAGWTVLVASAAALLAVVAVVVGGSYARPSEQLELVVPAGASAQAQMLDALGAREVGRAPASRRALALEERLNQALHGAQHLGDVDHDQLERVLREHLSSILAENDKEGVATQDPFPDVEAAFSPEHQAELEEEVQRLRSENAALKEAGRANMQIKAPLWPYQDYHFGYPWGYDKNNGWHQEIESYSPTKDGCDCSINNYNRYLTCTCGSAWGALTLQDEACYGCCTHGCCNRCTCHTSSAGDNMGPTTCSCPLARNWDRSNSNGCPGWWSDNAGPLDPGGTGGIPDIEDTPGELMV